MRGRSFVIFGMKLSSLEVWRRELGGLTVDETDNLDEIDRIYEDVACVKVSVPDMC